MLFPSSLDLAVKTRREEHRQEGRQRPSTWTRRQKRIYQRVMSGLEMAKLKGEHVRFLTLTSSPSSTREISKSFATFVKRARRKFGKFEYVKIQEFTKSGLKHLHTIYRGEYMPQAWISEQWTQIHSAPIVYIERVKTWSKGLGSYVAKYIAKAEDHAHMSTSWNWCYRGSCRDWKDFVHKYQKQAVQEWKKHLARVVLYQTVGRQTTIDRGFVNDSPGGGG